MGWVHNFIKRAMAIQENVLYDFTEEKKQAGYGRAARIIVNGSEGGIFDLWFCEKGVRPKPENVEVKNTVYMTEDTLLDLITPDVGLETLAEIVNRQGGLEKALTQIYPRLDFRTAIANGLVVVSGETSDIDSEEWSRILENVLLKISFPIVIKGLLRKRSGGK